MSEHEDRYIIRFRSGSAPPKPILHERPSYEAEVVERMTLLRREHPGETNWGGYATAEHEAGECVECDALRRLERGLR